MGAPSESSKPAAAASAASAPPAVRFRRYTRWEGSTALGELPTAPASPPPDRKMHALGWLYPLFSYASCQPRPHRRRLISRMHASGLLEAHTQGVRHLGALIPADTPHRRHNSSSTHG